MDRSEPLLAPIDPHVHLRGSEHITPFLPWALDDAQSVGLAGLCSMPNRFPPTLTIQDGHRLNQDVLAHFNLNRSSLATPPPISPPPPHHPHIGLTVNPTQVSSFLTEASAQDPQPSCKGFFANSTLNMGMVDPDYQAWFWRYAVQSGYHGVVLCHCEDEATFSNLEACALSFIAIGQHLTSLQAFTHSVRRNLFSELSQVQRQVRLATDAHFTGTLYICHVSNPITVNFLLAERTKHLSPPPFQIIIEASFHHLFLNTQDYAMHSSRLVMNPPLRPEPAQKALLDHCLSGHIDVLGSDHAPHTLLSKDGPKPPSGIPTLPFWPKALSLLQAKMDLSTLNQMVFHTPNRLFHFGLTPQPYHAIYQSSLWDKYGYNPFYRLDNPYKDPF